MIEIDGLTKRYGDKTAVDGLSFVVEPGLVTGFLGPNGAGKSTTMRMIAGLDRPTSGSVRVNGKHYPQAPAPMAELGILLDARSVHPGLSARNNLLALARTAGISRRRVDEVIELAGLAEVAGTRAGGFSLGMGQRLGVAAALLG
jgi:ABC-2 type transport system ATP-binding protein